MEYVTGGSIGACLRKQGKLGVCVVKSFTAQIISGLEYLHAKDILHRVGRACSSLVFSLIYYSGLEG
jgi:mitogen-activated protein kinase kinase kinase